ncbi:CE1759 family FMN reductase [Nocardioides pantholopis]|uniref:CE1759 family FMN reductase n=1 Tax=Nocardioides pantholopis TaxID=2483798 RepID=UPI000F098D8D|nr:CE1759 family FMN reductase [Nocardioides pantholopis]
MTRLVVVSAGLSTPSSTQLLADRLAAAVGEALEEVEVTRVELRALAHELTDQLLTGFPGAALSAAQDAVRAADGVVAVTPIYSASYSGLFKTFFDVLEPGALDGTPVLIAATGGTGRHSLALEHALRPLFAHLRAVVVPTGVYAATDDFAGTDLDARISRAAGELALLAGKVSRTDAAAPAARGRRTAAEELADPTPFEQLLREASGG